MKKLWNKGCDELGTGIPYLDAGQNLRDANKATRITHGVRVVVVSPHRDDAAFSLGLSIDHWLHAGYRVDVLNCFTQSEYAPYSDVESLHRNDRRSFVSALRRREDAAWNKRLGGQLRITDLDLLDAPLRLACTVDEVLTVEIRSGDRALSRVAGALRKLASKAEPDDLALFVPLAVGGHIDHRIVRQAALEALTETRVPVAFYEDLPYAARPGAAEEVEGLAASANLALQPAFSEVPAEDLEACVARKYRMAECYDSQIDNSVAEAIAAFCVRHGGRERVWGSESWLACSLAVPPAAEVSA